MIFFIMFTYFILCIAYNGIVWEQYNYGKISKKTAARFSLASPIYLIICIILGVKYGWKGILWIIREADLLNKKKE